MNFLMREFLVFCVFCIFVYAEENGFSNDFQTETIEFSDEFQDDACELVVTVVSNDELKDSYLSGCYNMIATVNDRPAYKVSFMFAKECNSYFRKNNRIHSRIKYISGTI